MNEHAAKVGVWGYLLFTLASLIMAIVFFFTSTGMGNIAIIALPLWMAYTVFSVIKSAADLIGRQQRSANFTRMLDRWQDTFGSRGKALALLTFMTVAVGVVKLLVPLILVQF